MFGQIANKRLVSTALPGPTISFQLPSTVEPPGSIICGRWCAMGDQHRIAAIRCKNAQGPVGDGHRWQDDAALQPEIGGAKVLTPAS
jgi:hypothetical protein